MDSAIPNLRKESAIYNDQSHLKSKMTSVMVAYVVRRVEGEDNLRVHIARLESLVHVVIDSSEDGCDGVQS